jgi:hypothetical protein
MATGGCEPVQGLTATVAASTFNVVYYTYFGGF